jgi:hypothetical protein
MFSIVLLTALAQPAPAAPSGAQPAQVVARIDAKGNLTITTISNAPNPAGCYGLPPAPFAPGKEPVKVKVRSVLVTTMELAAKEVEAYSVDGKRISAETLASLLEKDRPVLLALDGKKPDPFQLQLYKEGTIVLVPPANTLNLGGYGGPGFGRFDGRPDGPPTPSSPREISPEVKPRDR